MPITRSAKKALRQSKRRHAHNLAQMKVLKETLKKYKKSPSAELLSQVYKKLDKAVKANLIKKNNSSRLKSRLSSSLYKLSAKSKRASS